MRLWLHLAWRYHVEAARRSLARWHRHVAKADAMERRLGTGEPE